MTTPAERARDARHAIAAIIAEHGGQWNGAVDAAVDAVLRQAFREPRPLRYPPARRRSPRGATDSPASAAGVELLRCAPATAGD